MDEDRWDRTPRDWENPEWEVVNRIHNWRNHISKEIAAAWNTFTPEQKQMLARQAEESASYETWE